MQDVVNPTTGKVIDKVSISTKEEIDAAVAAAKEAFPDWRRTTPLARSRCLFRLKELLEEKFEEISRIQLLYREQGGYPEMVLKERKTT